MYAMEYASTHVFEIFILFLMNYLLELLIHFLIELFIFSRLSAVHSVQILDNSLLSNMTSPIIFNCLLFPYNYLPQITKNYQLLHQLCMLLFQNATIKLPFI